MNTMLLDIPGDPEVAFQRIQDRTGAVWLDDPGTDGPTFMACSPSAQLIVTADGRVRRSGCDDPSAHEADPVQAITAFVREADGAPSAPWTVGYLSYDFGPAIEPRIPAPRPDEGTPTAYLARYDAMLECNREADGGAPSWRMHERIPGAGRALAERLRTPAPSHGTADARPQLREAPDEARHVCAVQRALEYIAAGDIYQVNLAQRFRVGTDASAYDVYRRLRHAQPVSRGLFLHDGKRTILSNSPERFLRVSGNDIETEPIKGTRARGADPTSDGRRARELARDPKERAEHVMIVDLERNDLGRICRPGTVHVEELGRIDSYTTLHHMVSQVRGELRTDVGLTEILRATFPGGSITGAPKIRATQIIRELESHARGVYTGAFFAFRSSTEFDSTIAIRTAVHRDGEFLYLAGGGIVADSDPHREFAEVWLKARPFLAATLGPACDEAFPDAALAVRDFVGATGA